jgi:DNA-binding NtrC family response regulator
MFHTIKILAIDREEIILKSIRKALQSNENVRYIVNTCETALDALKLIRSDTYDLVFIDLTLAGMNGLELLRRIKNIHADIPVIIMSGSPLTGIHFKSDEEKAGNENLNNASGFLLKPFTTEEIRSLVSNLVALNPAGL